MPADKFTAEVNAITNDPKKSEVFERYVSISSVAEIEAFFKTTNGSVEEFELNLKPLISLFKQLETLGLSEYVKFDPSIVRGLDYYTDVVFEIFDKHPDNRRAIAGGGAYANLLAIFGETPLPGIGFGLGEVPLTEFLKSHNLLPNTSKQDMDVMVAYQDLASEQKALELAQAFRTAGLKTEVFLGEAKPKKIYTSSDRKQPNTLVILSAEEIASGEIQLKNLKTKEVHKLNISTVDKMIEVIKGSR
jgi:histidyl-tRNA synthetase